MHGDQDARDRVSALTLAISVRSIPRIVGPLLETTLTIQQLKVLSAVVVSGGATTTSLIQRFEVSMPAMSKLLDRLVAQGLVERVTDGQDQRVRRIRPTELGRDVLSRVVGARPELGEDVLRGLDRHELSALETGLRAIDRELRRLAVGDDRGETSPRPSSAGATSDGRGSPVEPERARPSRSDAARNRLRLIASARTLFAESGQEVALEEVARRASVSRATLYRHFATREELVATIYEANVDRIEVRARELEQDPSGVIALFDFVFDMQVADRSLAGVLAGSDSHWLERLSVRTEEAFDPLVRTARSSGVTREGVGLGDVMLAFSMAAGALSDSDVRERDGGIESVRTMLHRSLFASGAPSP